ncbi:hypothetical protein M3Y97_00577600 [Aphelenchoides bicaudatus]|nr:hypothetical protein M3Y97_00577600 [Aphelenchoides bicaudatus]
MAVSFWAYLTIFILLVTHFRRRIIDRCRLIYYLMQLNGPISIPVLGSLWMMKWRTTELTVQLLEWTIYYMQQRIDLVCFWVSFYPVVAAFSADSVKAILESNVVISKSDEYKILKRWLGDGLLISSGEKWRRRRKLLTPAFHFNILHGFHIAHDRESQVFLEQIDQFADTKKPFDIYPFLKRFALDVICETAMGVKVDAQLNHNHPYVLAVKKLNKLSFAYGRMPWLWLSPIWALSGFKTEYEKNLKLVTDFTKNVIADRRHDFELDVETSEYNHKKSVFLDLLLNMQKEGDLTDEDIRNEVDTFMFEGHDTTSSGMSWTLWCIAHHADVQQKVLEEVDSVFGCSNRSCTMDDLKNLPYLEQCIKESHRLFSPVPLMFRKTEKDFECVGKTIPKNTTLLIAPVLVHISADHYETPFAFNPDHFSQESSVKRHPFAYIPFSAGPRNCIGQKFALQVEKTLLSWFFRKYTIKPNLAFFRNFPLPEIILKPSRGTPVKIEKRHKC